MTSNLMHLAKDFSYPWRAARALLDGQNPYDVIRAVGEYPFNAPFLYPLPAAVIAMPLAPLSAELAGAIFVGASSTLLAWGLVGKAPHQLWIFLSAPFVHAAGLGQWSPLLTAAALTPALQFAAAAKPTIGLVAWLYRPSWYGVVGSLAFVVIALAILPSWPMDWLEAVRTTRSYRGPATTFAGAFLLLSVLRWRRREARLLLSLSLVPQLPVFYETVPLWLVPNTWLRSFMLTVASWIGYIAWGPSAAAANQNEVASTLTLATIWAPALLLVLLLPAREEVPTAGDRASEASA